MKAFLQNLKSLDPFLPIVDVDYANVVPGKVPNELSIEKSGTALLPNGKTDTYTVTVDQEFEPVLKQVFGKVGEQK